jgi:hypothetical protein
VDAAVLTAACAALVGDAITPSGQLAVALPSAEPTDVVRRGGPLGPVPPVLPTIVPTDAQVWEPSLGPVIVDGRPLPSPTVSVVPAAPVPESVEQPPLAAGASSGPADDATDPPLVGVPDVPAATEEPSPDPEPLPDPIVPVIPEPVVEPSASTSTEVQEPPVDAAPTTEPAP